MDDFDDIPNHLFISLRYNFSATRVVDTRFSPTNIKFKLDLSPKEDDSEEYAVQVEMCLTKFEHFVKNVLEGSLLIGSDNEWALESFMCGEVPHTTNPIVLFPEMPTDAVLCELLIRKFNAITNNLLTVHSFEIESSDGRGMGFTFVGAFPGEDFPGMNDWVGERTYFSKPWWDRDDASTLDVIPEEDADLNSPPKWAYDLGFIKPMHNVYSEHNVVRREFRPTIIEGGKKD